jgi:CRP-like cAMP-binding protein
VRQFALFADISLVDRGSIISSARLRHFSQRQAIFVEGEPIRRVVLLLEGCVKLTQSGSNGQEVILRLAGPGELVGELGSGNLTDYCSTAIAVEPSSALVWNANDFAAVGDRFPVLRRNATRALERRLNDIDTRFREISTEKVSPRLSKQLVRLLYQVGKCANGEMTIALSRRELAQLTGTTLFTVSRLLCQWELRGIVTPRRKAVLVRDLAALVGLAQEE